MSKKTRIHRPTTATPKKPLMPRILHQSTFLENHIDRRTGAKKLVHGAKGATFKRMTMGEALAGFKRVADSLPTISEVINTPEDNSPALVKMEPRLTGELLPDPPAEVVVDVEGMMESIGRNIETACVEQGVTFERITVCAYCGGTGKVALTTGDPADDDCLYCEEKDNG